jgi:hypothetical protein
MVGGLPSAADMKWTRPAAQPGCSNLPGGDQSRAQDLPAGIISPEQARVVKGPAPRHRCVAAAHAATISGFNSRVQFRVQGFGPLTEKEPPAEASGASL